MSQKPLLDPADMARIPFLQGLLPAEVEALCSAGRVREFGKGDFVFRQGDEGQELFVIISGEVAIELTLPEGGTRTLAGLQAGTVFGEINFLVGSQRTATARALRDTRLLVFRRDDVESLEGIGRQAAANMMETIARVLALRLANMNREMSALTERLMKDMPGLASVVRDTEEKRQALLHSWDY